MHWEKGAILFTSASAANSCAGARVQRICCRGVMRSLPIKRAVSRRKLFFEMLQYSSPAQKLSMRRSKALGRHPS